VACIAEADAAIALSRGGARKPYAHKEANEDAACFAVGRAGTLLAVADGHAGAEASELAVALLLDRTAPEWTDAGVPRDAWREAAGRVLAEVHAHIVRFGAETASDARTTLSLALVLPESGYCGWAAVGDSHVFSVGERTEEHGAAGSDARFLGSPLRSADELAVRGGSFALAERRAVLLATDGLTEPGIGVADPLAAAAGAVAEASGTAAPRRPLAAARTLAECALAAHREHRAGDNVATAACWLEAGE
jgi:serine/threonine protein phosphatase PrpC